MDRLVRILAFFEAGIEITGGRKHQVDFAVGQRGTVAVICF